VKWLKVRKAYTRRKSGQQYREELKRLSKLLLLAKKSAQESLTVRENAAAIKDATRQLR
jgi:uncharacterized membrane-anchored protein